MLRSNLMNIRAGRYFAPFSFSCVEVPTPSLTSTHNKSLMWRASFFVVLFCFALHTPPWWRTCHTDLLSVFKIVCLGLYGARISQKCSNTKAFHRNKRNSHLKKNIFKHVIHVRNIAILAEIFLNSHKPKAYVKSQTCKKG